MASLAFSRLPTIDLIFLVNWLLAKTVASQTVREKLMNANILIRATASLGARLPPGPTRENLKRVVLEKCREFLSASRKIGSRL